MDGPMRPYLPELTIRDYNIYQWYLRGVQYQLNTTYGLYSCSLLQHNGVLFALLSDSLAGREATCKKVRLPWTLCWRPMMCQTQGIRLAAQVEVLLGWHKLQAAASCPMSAGARAGAISGAAGTESRPGCARRCTPPCRCGPSASLPRCRGRGWSR